MHFINENPTVIVIGRLNFRKKLHYLIEAIYILKKNKCPLNLVIVGEGEDKSKLEEIVQERGLDKNVWFYGACYDESENAELIYNADLCVVPGDIGLTAIHCLMFGCPCITHNNWALQGPEFESIIDGITGTFYEHDNVEDLSNKINNWLINNQENRQFLRVQQNMNNKTNHQTIWRNEP